MGTPQWSVPKIGHVSEVPYCGTDGFAVPAFVLEAGFDVSADVSAAGRLVVASSSLEPPPQPTSNIENNVNGTSHRRFFMDEIYLL
jgi:hypothetical protein